MRVSTFWKAAVCFALTSLPLSAQSLEPAPMAYKAAAEAKFSNHPATGLCRNRRAGRRSSQGDLGHHAQGECGVCHSVALAYAR